MNPSLGISVISLNCFLLVPWPIRYTSQDERSDRMGHFLSGMALDYEVAVICLQEMDLGKGKVVHHLKRAGFCYHCTAPSPRMCKGGGLFKMLSAGLVIFSRTPILDVDFWSFSDHCVEGAERFVSKGVLMAEVQYHHGSMRVYNTHLQAWNTKPLRARRAQQVKEISNFIEEHRVLRGELPYIVCGDFNIDMYSNPEEIQDIQDKLGIHTLDLSEDSLKFSSDPQTNMLVGLDDASMYSTERFPNGCLTETLDLGTCVCCPQELLDFIGLSRGHWEEGHSARVVPTRVNPFTGFVTHTTERNIDVLSDHHAMVSSPLRLCMEWELRMLSPGKVVPRVPTSDALSNRYRCVVSESYIWYYVVAVVFVLLFLLLLRCIHRQLFTKSSFT